jgi:hypothetical protein
MRKITLDIEDIIDLVYVSMNGEAEEYLLDFMKDDCKITKEEVQEYGRILGSKKPYTEEDTKAVLDFADEIY